VQWDEKLNIKSTLLQTPSTGKFDAKTIDFHVISVRPCVLTCALCDRCRRTEREAASPACAVLLRVVRRV
jgi:hypothetical protein